MSDEQTPSLLECNDCQVPDDDRKAAEALPPCAMTEKCVAACAAYGKVCPCAARLAAHSACESMTELLQDSEIFLEKPDFEHINSEDIVMEEKIGQGGFSNVNRCVVKGTNYAVKYLKRQAMVDLHTFRHGAADLAVEAFFLYHLDHPNIVELHGVSAGSVESNVASGKECGFFIVVDLLEETLEKRIEKWTKEREQAQQRGILSRLSPEFVKQKRRELIPRYEIALEIAKAVKYLHSRKIVFRDLKPDNIGFDKDGTLKLFDFGLAKELKGSEREASGRYRLTGNTGSRRYMAPEVAKDIPYDQSVDVYSFGILLWELCAAEKPFFGYSSGKHMQQVVMAGERPKIDSDWPESLQWLLRRCWSSCTKLRPDLETIVELLEDLIDGKDIIPGNQTMKEEPTPEDSPVVPEQSLIGLKGLFGGSKRNKTTGGRVEGSSSNGNTDKGRRRRSWGIPLL